MKPSGGFRFEKARFAPFILCLLVSPAFALDFNSSLPAEELAPALVEAMSDEEALAQTLMFGWRGAEPSPEILAWIESRHIGGVKVFGWNTASTTTLARTIGTMQEAAVRSGGLPLLVATDQEGGLIRHVKGATSETPGNMAIGASGYPRDAYLSGYYIGRELALLGINMNFAPTVDLFTNTRSVLIGTRSFGDDPVKTGILGAAYAKGSLAAGVIPTAKHFPGHGDTELDSHGILPAIDAEFDILWEREMAPYRLLAKEGLPAIMSGHLAFPKTPAGMTPASLSGFFLTETLRDKIGYEGLIITDDLLMNGALGSTGNLPGNLPGGLPGSLARAAKQALTAGNDILMMNSTQPADSAVWTELLASMRREPEFRARVRDAARRVVQTKLTYLRGEGAVPLIPDVEKVRRELPDSEGGAFFQSLAARSTTIVNGGAGLFPLDATAAGRVLLAGQYLDFFSIGKRAFPEASSYWYNAPVAEDLLRRARAADTIIFCLSNDEGLAVLREFRPLGKRIIILSVLNPAYLEAAAWASGAVAVYSYSPESFIAGFSAITGRIPAQGSVPFGQNSR